MNFVTCKLVGPSEIGGIHYYGLANQMFQIATVISYANQNNLTPLFPMLKEEKYGNYTENIFRKLDLSEVDSSEIALDYHQPDFSYSDIPSSNKVRLNGYFQSELYFKSDRNLILETFSPTDEILNYIYKKYNALLNDSLSIHLRYGDYRKIQDHHPLLSKTNYYENILEINKRKNLLVFSDDINRAKKVKAFKNFDVNFITNEPEHIDLFLMSLCNDNAIANSSFSWWGAWLNKNNNKNVYYPETWFGPAKSEFEIKDLIPDGWTKIESKTKKNKIFNF
tara:strand:+ start:7165 stop:8004 length:840 start_codon:yes stop_codon:yes gene_type:complete